MGDVRRTSEVRQVELTDAALHIIATRGIGAVSTRSLAEQVGLSSGAIFRHFASLDAVLDASDSWRRAARPSAARSAS